MSGVHWQRHGWGVECFALVDGFLVSRKYAGNGSDRVTVRDAVRAYRRDVLRVGK